MAAAELGSTCTLDAQEPTERTPLLGSKFAAIATQAEVLDTSFPLEAERTNRFDGDEDSVEALLRSRTGGCKRLVKDSAELELEAGPVGEDDGTMDERLIEEGAGGGCSQPSFWQIWTWDTSNMKSLFQERHCAAYDREVELAESDSDVVEGNKGKGALARYCRHCWETTQIYYSHVTSLSEEGVQDYCGHLFWHLWRVTVMYYSLMRSISRRDAMWLLAVAAMITLFLALLVKTQFMDYQVHGCYWNCKLVIA